ncbi:MAG: hypothetical protein AVDCRST_MAG88-2485, partial [uncultured Thermomicrobiales bacterium]
GGTVVAAARVRGGAGAPPVEGLPADCRRHHPIDPIDRDRQVAPYPARRPAGQGPCPGRDRSRGSTGAAIEEGVV